MTDDELAMAYADGELGPIEAKRFEARLRADPALATTVADQRALGATLRAGFAPIADAPVPDRLAALLHANVVELRPAPRRDSYWRAATAMAACLVAGVAIGHLARGAPSGVEGGPLLASGRLAQSLDQQLAGTDGATRMLVSFRASDGRYCRVFATSAIDGIACRDDRGWALRQTQAASGGAAGTYRQAASTAPAILAAAQNMMAGAPLDSAAERVARMKGWR